MQSAVRRISVPIGIAIGISAAGVLGYAQGQKTKPPVFQTRPDVPLTAPTILSGPDIGFRVESWRGDTPIGKLIVKVDGKWVEVEFASGFKRTTTR